MKVAVIGAGLAGVAAARRLLQAGAEPTLFERAPYPGGRCGTRQVGGYLFDHGATSVAPRGRALEKAMLEEVSQLGLERITKPVWTMAYGRVAPGDAARMSIDRYTYTTGMRTLPERLAEGVSSCLETDILEISKAGEKYVVANGEFDALILSLPVSSTEKFLTQLGERRSIMGSRYRQCLTVLMGYAEELPETQYHALIEPEQRSPVIWISLESAKCAGRAPAGHSAIIAQFGSQFSRDHFEDSDLEIMREASSAVSRLFGTRFKVPEIYQVKRWKHSHPEAIVNFDKANPPGTKVLLAGDGLLGPRLELAYETGILAAERLLSC